MPPVLIRQIVCLPDSDHCVHERRLQERGVAIHWDRGLEHADGLGWRRMYGSVNEEDVNSIKFSCKWIFVPNLGSSLFLLMQTDVLRWTIITELAITPGAAIGLPRSFLVALPRLLLAR